VSLLDPIMQGILLGGLYALFAAGLSLIFGVMRLVNIAHGDLIVLAAYLAYGFVALTGLHPLLSLALVVPLMALFGYALQVLVLNRTMSGDILPPLLVTFGISIILQNGLLTGFSADSRRLPAGSIETQSIGIAGINLGVLPLVTFAIAVLLIIGLEFLFSRTRVGRAFRATSDDAEMARAIGLNTRNVFGFAMALSMVIVAIAAVLLGMRSNFDPFSGPARLIYGFEAVIIGGLGSLWGTLIGGVVLGLAQSLGAQISPSFQIVAGHIVFFLILALRPRGLFPKAD